VEKLLVILSLSFAVQAVAAAEPNACLELLPKGAAAPGFGQPRLYECSASVIRPSEQAEEGFAASKTAVEDAAAVSPEVSGCRLMDFDQYSKFMSFCAPGGACDRYTTALYFSCGSRKGP
jgi:hypothetical protein